MKKQISILWILLIQAILGIEWLKAGWEKLGGDFAKSLPKTLAKFASENPYLWYKNFLLNTATPNASLFAFLVKWGEFLAGLIFLIGAVLLFFNLKNKGLVKFILVAVAISSFVTAFMNLNFWLAAGWTSVSTYGFNIVMFLEEIVLLFFAITILKTTRRI